MYSDTETVNKYLEAKNLTPAKEKREKSNTSEVPVISTDVAVFGEQEPGRDRGRTLPARDLSATYEWFERRKIKIHVYCSILIF